MTVNRDHARTTVIETTRKSIVETVIIEVAVEWIVVDISVVKAHVVTNSIVDRIWNR